MSPLLGHNYFIFPVFLFSRKTRIYQPDKHIPPFHPVLGLNCSPLSNLRKSPASYPPSSLQSLINYEPQLFRQFRRILEYLQTEGTGTIVKAYIRIFLLFPDDGDLVEEFEQFLPRDHRLWLDPAGFLEDDDGTGRVDEWVRELFGMVRLKKSRR